MISEEEQERVARLTAQARELRAEKNERDAQEKLDQIVDILSDGDWWRESPHAETIRHAVRSPLLGMARVLRAWRELPEEGEAARRPD